MFSRNRETPAHDRGIDRVPDARGGVAVGPILTGVVVAFGAMFLLSAVVGGVIAALGYNNEITTNDAMTVGIGAGIALIIAQFLSYLWGGYTAGRMSRGAGAANGVLVPVAAILVALLVGGIAAALGTQARLNLPFETGQLPLEDGNAINWGVGIGIGSLVAMFLGGLLGGILGSRWHGKLERRTYEEEAAAHDRPVREDSRRADAATTTTAAGRDDEVRRDEHAHPDEGVHGRDSAPRVSDDRRLDRPGNGHTKEEIDLSEERSRR